ncbi:MAG: hypothetical protein ABI678_12130 [Kofleriaceae bacterium]
MTPEPPAGSQPRDVAVELESPRQRLLSWTVFGIVFGAVLVWKLGTVGVWVGWVLIALGLYRGFRLAQTFMYPPGEIQVSATRVVLPRCAHRPRALEVKPAEVTAAYLLRNSVPMYHAAPVLVIELGSRALLYPRDWFAEEKDQRLVVEALQHHIAHAN